MKKKLKIAAFFVVIGMTAITLTSGISKEYRGNGGYKDLVEELYRQAVKQTDNLESIEDGIDKFYKKKNEAVEKYNSFIAYNNRYYEDAKSNAAAITEAATKQKAMDIIQKSEENYQKKMADWKTSIAALNANEKELNDLHALLEIMITAPLIEKYQTTGFPDNSKLKEANSDLLNVIEKIKAITH
jgi:formyltetrahydrofolate synthetase